MELRTLYISYAPHIVESTNSGAEYSAIRRIQTKELNLTLPDVEIGEVCVYMT